MINPAKALYDEIAATLVSVAESRWYSREAAANGAPPRYVWVPGGGTLEGARATGRNPRVLAQLPFRCAVVCWGADDDEAWRLLAALVSVVQRAANGRNYQVGRVAYTSPPWIAKGVSITVDVDLLVTVNEYDFDGAAGPSTDGDRTLPVVAPVEPETISPALSVAGDNLLESNES